MSLADLLERYMGDVVTVEPFLATPASDGSTRWDTTAARTFRGRVEQLARMVRDKEGREVVSQTRIYLAPRTTDGEAYAPTPNDRFTLPAGYYPQQPPCLSLRRENDENGLHHWVVDL